MKHLFLFNILLLLFYNQLYSQNSEANFCITYQFSFLLDTLDANSMSNKEDIFLFSNKDGVFFLPSNRYLRDSVSFDYLGPSGFSQFVNTPEKANKALQDILERTRAYSRSWYPFQIIFEKKKGDFHTIFTTSSRVYAAKEKVDLVWDITNETDTIAGYHTIKATTHYAGRGYEAWFAPDIPIPYGPYKFKGLPGLIVKVNDVDNKFSFEMTVVKGPTKMYFEKKWREMGMKMQRTDFLKKVHSEFRSASPDIIEITGETASEKASMAAKQKETNSKKFYLMMELY